MIYIYVAWIVCCGLSLLFFSTTLILLILTKSSNSQHNIKKKKENWGKITYIISLKIKSEIHVGISSKMWKLGNNVAALASSWANFIWLPPNKLDMRVC